MTSNKWLVITLMVTACGTQKPEEADAGSEAEAEAEADAGNEADAGSEAEADAGNESDAGPLATCPPTITPDAGCFTFTPADTGALSTGENATEAHYALEPATTPRNELLIYFNASLSNPRRQLADPTRNFYNAAAASGLHVLALSYSSQQVLGITCNNNAPCFALARETLIRGIAQPGAPTSMQNIREDEGVLYRLDAALRHLAATRPNAGWGQFLQSGPTPATRIIWSKLMTAGHSQGGGHAAFMAKLFPVTRVIQLSSTCDATGTTPAPWTSDAMWMSPPATTFIGFATSGDTICPHHVAIWNAMGINAARQYDDAALCGGNPHQGSVGCADNYERWLTLF